MAYDSQTTLTVHGLDGDNKAVRADVFTRKLRALLAGLAVADKAANGKSLHRFMIEDLRKGSAQVQIGERRRFTRPAVASGIITYEKALRAVYNGDRSTVTLPRPLLRSIKQLGAGVGSQFSHAEVRFQDCDVIRVDQFLLTQAERALSVSEEIRTQSSRLYKGLAVGSFDGVLRVMDARGDALLAKLVTTAGSLEIDCVINKVRIPEVRNYFDVRVRVEGTAHYNGLTQLPVRLDIHSVRPVKTDADLKRWRGAFRAPSEREDW
ncbi:hypothetical protein SAMN05216330_1011056 [Bradyrhizobium sp. Ghvi]|uniref:hypothetical protein n=1 Tax=Bradyrhizobium sp. Ghvi TaxID=1855319 RepID=UPI0008E95377|nr:hypothetical protein [Bradyrhizobium sp. Ghvi]SFN95567.1 hypothetical protein SAMN05216330_1011056 [Bradyrhizobium sp. Ghvi]